MDPDWASLHGTYGPAGDLPGHLRALRSPDGDVRRKALVEVSDAVVHQGTRWQVSAYVVPVLVGLVDDPATPDRGALVALLRDVALGPRDDSTLPFDPDAAFTHPPVTRDQEEMVVQRVYHSEDGFDDDRADVADACAEKWDHDAYVAAAAHTGAYRRWLADDDPEVASTAAALLAWFPGDAETVTALRSADRNDAVRASANLALGHLDGPVERLTSLLDHDALLVRLTAAVALAHRTGRDLPDRTLPDRALPDRALSVLVDAAERENLPDFPPGWHRRAPRGYVALALQRLGLG